MSALVFEPKPILSISSLIDFLFATGPSLMFGVLVGLLAFLWAQLRGAVSVQLTKYIEADV